jgi:hypothetical protein
MKSSGYYEKKSRYAHTYVYIYFIVFKFYKTLKMESENPKNKYIYDLFRIPRKRDTITLSEFPRVGLDALAEPVLDNISTHSLKSF